MEFEIYDKLKEDIGSVDYEMGHELRATINRLSIEHREIIYTMIYHHAKLNNTNETIPYRGKVSIGGKGVTFDVKNLPADLICILVKYLNKVSKD